MFAKAYWNHSPDLLESIRLLQLPVQDLLLQIVVSKRLEGWLGGALVQASQRSADFQHNLRPLLSRLSMQLWGLAAELDMFAACYFVSVSLCVCVSLWLYGLLLTHDTITWTRRSNDKPIKTPSFLSLSRCSPYTPGRSRALPQPPGQTCAASLGGVTYGGA